MKCLSCKQNPGNPKYCGSECEVKARERLGRIIKNLKTKKMPWGGEILRGEEEDVVE